MLLQVTAPTLFSEACHEYSARFDLAAFDPQLTPSQLGVVLPPSLLRAAPVRQAEFVAGRFAATTALRAAGYQGVPDLAIREDRSVSWPPGFVGSITHVTGYASAVAGRSSAVRALGRDSERVLDDAAALEIQAQILRPEELRRQAASGLGRGLYTGVIFSAKESLYKALAPLVQRYFDFQDAQVVELSTATGEIRIRLEADLGAGFAAGFELEARFAITDLVHTAVELRVLS